MIIGMSVFLGGDNGTDLGGNYDWFDGVSRTGFGHNHNISVSGGNERANFRVSGDYKNSHGVDLRSKREEYGGRASAGLNSKGGLFNLNINLAHELFPVMLLIGTYSETQFQRIRQPR